mmetsp:Transcript_127421/g.366460  ORF Transcript_127421/g.366460 Transcript_127421/m.366460 type:complete len:296 (-) Transcript_127421:292-1179(-)
MRLLLRPGQPHGVAAATVGKALLSLDEEPARGAVFRSESEKHDIYDADEFLVAVGVQHEPASATLNLRRELRQGLSLVLAEDFVVDVVLLELLLEEAHVAARRRGPLAVLGRPRLDVQEPATLDPRRIPPLVRDLAAPRGLVGQLEALARVVHRALQPHGALATCAMHLVEAVHQNLPSLLDAIVHLLLAEGRAARPIVLLRNGHAGRAPAIVDARQPGVVRRFLGAQSRLLLLLQHPQNQVFANPVNPGRHLHLLRPRILLVPEGEAPGDEPVQNDAQCEDIDLRCIIAVVELG